MTGALHFSRLKLMAISPAHYRYGKRRDTTVLGFGTIVHALVLGGDAIVFDGERTGNAWAAFKALVAGEPHRVFDGAHQGKAWQAVRDEARAADEIIVTSRDVEAASVARYKQAERIRAGRYTLPIVTRAEYDRAQECADAVLRDPLAVELLTGSREVPLRWRYLGRDCAGQLDVFGNRLVSELKTTACAEPSWFQRQAFKMAYHAQLAWYSEAARQHGCEPERRGIVAVETRPPYAITTFLATDRAIEEGERLIRMWMEQLAVCEAADHWPAYVQSTVELDTAPDVELIYPEDTEEEAA